jgi:hypothetical protein
MNNNRQQQVDAGLQRKQQIMDLIASGAYDNYARSANVDESQFDPGNSMNYAQLNKSAYIPPPQAASMQGPQLPSLDQGANMYAAAQNPMFTPNRGVRGDFTQRNNALAEMDAAIQQRQQLAAQRPGYTPQEFGADPGQTPSVNNDALRAQLQTKLRQRTM